MTEATRQYHYIVTTYGCNSSPSAMWIPESRLFTDFQQAYDFFIESSPDLNDPENEAECYVNSEYKPDNNTTDYLVIENRVQLGGYTDGEWNRAKRPMGVVIARIG